MPRRQTIPLIRGDCCSYSIARLIPWPLLGSPNYDAYLDTVLRGEPVTRPRMEAVPVIIPEPKPENAGSIFEIQEALQEREMAKQ